MMDYLLLTVITALLIKATAMVIKRTRQWTFAVGMVVLYAWTFLGAWFFIGDALSGYTGFRIGLNYYYLMEKMFPFKLNHYYTFALLGYALFMACLVGGVWMMLRRRTTGPATGDGPLVVDHSVFVLAACCGAVISFLMVRPLIAQAMAADLSIYQYTRHTAFLGSTLHALCNELVCLALLIGWAIQLTADRGRYFIQRGQRWARWAYPLMLAGFSIYLMLLGNRHELFMALLLGGLLFVANAITVPRARLLAYVLAAVLPMVITGAFRDYTWDSIKTLRTDGEHVQTPFDVPIIAHVPRHFTSPMASFGSHFLSNELFCAHFSLYGILKDHIHPSTLVSFRYLAASMVPVALRPERPPTAYDVYAADSGLAMDQGFTIHHAAGWYMNAGWAGIAIGGVLLGLCWGGLMRLRDTLPSGPLALRVFAVMGVACWVAYLPILVRDGPEIYKGLVFEGFLMPIGIVFLACVMGRRREVRERNITG